ncbi:translation initiation factor IF-2 subunit alpha [Candidatus Woesearchaeota archaeon CG10_big_fil_rev_8_21_14_0_10_44_13]|nr:MAG: translation initiation factor IF-2 subunit alpha [Candidatus Woesearchaeota archaeon CG10_big_fil_rev_8_21_14_0_10_44_13]
MLYTKKGFPEDSEIVLCTVTKIQHGSVFVTLDEYGHKTGIINISEISPGRIRNIRDFVNEGKKSICKVMRIDQQRGHIDLSLRRVTESQRRAKNDWIKQEQKAEKIVELIAKDLKVQMKEIYDKIINTSGYPNLFSCFEDVSMDKYSLEKILDKKAAENLTEMIKLKIRPPEFSVEGLINLVTYSPEGVDLIKEALKKAQGEDIVLQYIGGGRYTIKATADNYKKAEDMIKKSADAAINFLKSKGGEGDFVRKGATKAAESS